MRNRARNSAASRVVDTLAPPAILVSVRVPVGRLFILVLVLLCLGAGLASLALSEEIQHPEHYDGDADDTAAVGTHVALAIDAVVTTVSLLVFTSPSGRVSAVSVPPRRAPVVHGPSRLRAPPA
jgi:hypothetical protein